LDQAASTRITWHTEGVPQHCTCGATLPEDALFCHKCGKRQRGEEIVPEEAAPPPLPVSILPLGGDAPQLPAIGFHNGPAVRIALLTGVLSVLLMFLLGRVPAAVLPGMVAAGFFAVFLYRRRTGQRLTILHGAHLGWISGMFGFAIAAVLLTVLVVLLSNPMFLTSNANDRDAPASLRRICGSAGNLPVLHAAADLRRSAGREVLGSRVDRPALSRCDGPCTSVTAHT
jgi:hypothetical protein